MCITASAESLRSDCLRRSHPARRDSRACSRGRYFAPAFKLTPQHSLLPPRRLSHQSGEASALKRRGNEESLKTLEQALLIEPDAVELKHALARTMERCV